MKEQILSRSRIQPIIERFNLFAGSKYTMDDRVELTQKAIGIPAHALRTIAWNAGLLYNLQTRRTRALPASNAARSLTSLQRQF